MSVLENLQGGYLCGLVLDTILLGAITVQVFLYYHRFPKDHISLKFTVGFLWFIQTFQVMASTAAAYRVHVRHFGVRRTTTVWNDTFHQISIIICSTIVQFYFGFRLYRFSGSIWLPMPVVLLTLGQFGTGLAIWIKGNITHGLESLVRPVRHVEIAWLTLEVLADLVIAFAMSYFLLNRRTGFRQTDTVLRKLTVYAINTGLLTSVLALAVMFSVQLLPALMMHQVALTPYLRVIFAFQHGDLALQCNMLSRLEVSIPPPFWQNTQPDKRGRLVCGGGVSQRQWNARQRVLSVEHTWHNRVVLRDIKVHGLRRWLIQQEGCYLDKDHALSVDARSIYRKHR
ncbi:uncharacterized protein EI90DRAFT_3022993 [Cantharellus anzutake]|uniref:uncharacterized protein n=1 Tax=Cantharellus anzutake TaxID=1750568 RepID=UPI001908DD71|nr:uncharacterized protein EI90DRAFT_3022993 [Cantharellus anzutake]KAF8312553.1 hypothetical protein EI90DRAFT_3022993 [Cantharellus anzutake]